MNTRLSQPLGSYHDRDEFQIGQTLIWVRYVQNEDRISALSKAENILPALESDREKVEQLATKSMGSSFPAEVIGIMIEPDGSASYTCTFFDGEHEDNFVSITRDRSGSLAVNRA